jgi:hypothetical protein
MAKSMTVLDAEARQFQLEQEARRDAVAKKNFNFVQVEKKTMRDIRLLTVNNPKAAGLLFLLGEKMNKQNAIVMSQQTMISLTGWSRPTVIRAIKTLQDGKWLQVLRLGTANAYIINNAVFWQDSRDKKLTTFRAQVVVSADEQDESIEQMRKLKLRHLPFAELQEAQEVGADLLIGNDKLEPPDQGEMDV